MMTVIDRSPSVPQSIISWKLIQRVSYAVETIIRIIEQRIFGNFGKHITTDIMLYN